MPTTPPPVRYLTADDVWAINRAILQRECREAPLRDRGSLESAVARPQMVAYYEQGDLIAQATAMIVGIALAHPFLDANKRTALVAGATFLHLDGLQVTDVSEDFGRQIEAFVLAHDAVRPSPSTLETWLREHVVAI